MELGFTCVGAAFNENSPGDTCTEICGDGLVIGKEQCDDGNLSEKDGCNQLCQLEPGWEWTNGSLREKCGDGIRVGAG